jgi:hypothetical protein
MDALHNRKDPRLPSSSSSSPHEKKKTSSHHTPSFSDILRPGSSETKPKKEKKNRGFHLSSPLKHIGGSSPKSAGSQRLGSDMSGEEVRTYHKIRI